MVDFVQLQELMKERLAKDRTIQTVEARGPTLEDAVAEAATLLGVSLRRVEYEITEKGSPGFLGSGKKDWKIKAYQRAVEKKEKNKKGRSSGEEEFISPVIEDRDGDAFVFLGSEGAFLKVIPPVGRGRRANESHAMNALHARNVQEIDENAVRETVRQAAGVHVKVGTFAVNPMNDAMISVDIAAQEMKATIYLTPPGPGGCDLSVDAMLSFLHNNNVVFGINEVFLREFADRPRYNEAVLVAEGARP
ncbi:MAG: Jag N-terminal domain-containing protein, partial [Spirochaetaceae bacterium]|nr:Jag N-terminal domain-containing protein [Spirochaetaceae bacterium]